MMGKTIPFFYTYSWNVAGDSFKLPSCNRPPPHPNSPFDPLPPQIKNTLLVLRGNLILSSAPWLL